MEKANQINLDLASVEAVSEPTPLIRFNLSLTGSQARLLAFIEDLVALPYRLQFQSGKLQSENTEASDSSWDGDWVVELLSYQPEPESEKQNGAE